MMKYLALDNEETTISVNGHLSKKAMLTAKKI